jgi:hypothetical protein
MKLLSENSFVQLMTLIENTRVGGLSKRVLASHVQVPELNLSLYYWEKKSWQKNYKKKN